MKSYMWWLCLAVVVTGLALARMSQVWGAEGANEPAAADQTPGSAHVLQTPPVRVTLTPAMEAVVWHALKLAKCAMLTIAACHILLAVWVFLDIRKRGEGHGIFIALALLAGFCGAILYALVRLADTKRA